VANVITARRAARIGGAQLVSVATRRGPAATDGAVRRAPSLRPYADAMDQRRFRDTVGAFPTGVTIVTARGADGPAGLTTNAFASLSLDPPLVLVCFDNASRTLAVVRQARRFAVNVLRAGQEDLAAVFASKRVQAAKFAAVTHAEAHGVPVLDDALAWMVCDVHELVAGGDHTIGIGAVCALGRDDGEPLLFWRGEYRALG
jgi:flavin reductase (DIM6/NTAB) family NADH-FMN oxidoreductase RutF